MFIMDNALVYKVYVIKFIVSLLINIKIGKRDYFLMLNSSKLKCISNMTLWSSSENFNSIPIHNFNNNNNNYSQLIMNNIE